MTHVVSTSASWYVTAYVAGRYRGEYSLYAVRLNVSSGLSTRVTLYGLPNRSYGTLAEMGKCASCHVCETVSKVQIDIETTNVGVVQYWGEDPIEEHEADEDVHFGPPGHNERTWNPGDLGPVKGDDTHAQSAGNAKELVDGYIVGEYPAHKRKDGERLEEVCGEEEPDEAGRHEDHEIFVPGDCTRVFLLLGMKGIEEGTGDEILGPDHASGPDEETTADARKAESCELSTEHENKVEPEAERDLIEFLKDDDGVHSVRWGDGYIGHDEDERMFLDVPRAGVEGKFG